MRTAATVGYRDPIAIAIANTSLTLTNNNVAHSYVAGIYKDDKFLSYHTIAGRTLFATSLVEAAQGVFGDGYGIPEPAEFTMDAGNGEYRIKIRSGKPGSDDGSSESRQARMINIHRFIMGILRDNLPLGPGCAEQAIGKASEFLTGLYDDREDILSAARSPEVFAAVALKITGEAFFFAKDMLVACSDVPEDAFKFLNSLGKVFSLVSIAGSFMTAANVTAHTSDLFQSTAAIDTCFQVVGLKTFKCGEQITFIVTDAGGNKQNGKPDDMLPEPVRVKVTYEDGKPAIKAEVNWVITSGGGKLSTVRGTASYDGIAEAKWTLGTGNKIQRVEAYVNKKKESQTVVFTANAGKGVPYQVEILSGNGQYADPGRALPSPLEIKVTDEFKNPVSDMEVDWQIKSGGGSFLFKNNTTNTSGIATANWILGASDKQVVEVIVKKKYGNYLLGAPLRFTPGVAGNFPEMILGHWKVDFYTPPGGVKQDYSDHDDYLTFEKEGKFSHGSSVGTYTFIGPTSVKISAGGFPGFVYTISFPETNKMTLIHPDPAQYQEFFLHK